MEKTAACQKGLVILNPEANRKSTSKLWPGVASALKERGCDFRVLTPGTRGELIKVVGESIKSGESNIISAGGDGTLQAVIDGVMNVHERSAIRIGAIALGTSNDFHKPFDVKKQIAGFPCRLDENSGSWHDVMRLEAKSPEGIISTRYFVQSSHVGTIPSANARLTLQPGFFNSLYRIWYKFALLTVSAYEVFTYPGFSGEVKCGPDVWKGVFSGMSVMKRPHVAGNFVFATRRAKDDGLIDLALCPKVGSWKLISLIDKFEKEGLSGHPEVIFRETDEIEAFFDQPQYLDFDGELLNASWARWKVFPKSLWFMG